MNRNIFSVVLCVLPLMRSFQAEAQQPKSIPRIGYLSRDLHPADSRAPAPRNLEAFRQGLQELGYIEGKNIIVEYRYAEGKRDQNPQLAAELVRLKVDLILVTGGDPLIRAAKHATKTIPIVMVAAGIDPVNTGIIESLARPGGNVTGLTNLTAELGGKRLEVLKDAVSKLQRVAVLYDAGSPNDVMELKEVQTAARPLRLTVRAWAVKDADGFEEVFAAIEKERPDGLYIAGGPVTRANENRIVGFALKSRLPSLYTRRESVDAGGLLYYGADLAASYRRVAFYVDKILKGAKPADLPVEQPTKFELIINLKTAKQLGLTIPPNVLARADKLIR